MLKLSGTKSLQLLVFIVLSFTVVKISAQSTEQSIAPNNLSLTEKKKNFRPGESPEKQDLNLKAIEEYKTKILSSPNDILLYNNLGATFAKLGRYEEAIAAFQKAIEINPNAPNPYYNLGVVYDHLERFTEALENVRKAISINNKNANYQMQLCQVLLALENYKDAVPCHETLFQLQKPDVRIRTNYGISLLWSGQTEKAFDVLKQNAELFPNEAFTHNALGIAFYEKQKYKPAAECFARAIEINGKFDSARYNLALAQLMNKDRDSALKQYAFLKKTNSNFASQLFKFLFNGNVVRVNK